MLKEIQRLKAELKEKDEQCAKAIEDIKAEYEDKRKVEDHQRVAEIQRKVYRRDAVASGRLHEMKTVIETLKRDCEEKDAAIAGLTKELRMVKEEWQQEVQRLKAELKVKDEHWIKAIEDIKAEYEDKHKIEEQQKYAEVERKVKMQDVVASGRLREMKNEIKKWKKDCKEKDAAIVGLTKELEKVKEESQQIIEEV